MASIMLDIYCNIIIEDRATRTHPSLSYLFFYLSATKHTHRNYHTSPANEF